MLLRKSGLQLLQDYLQNKNLSGTENNFSQHWPVFAQRLIAKLTPKLMPSGELEELKALFQKEKGVNVCHHLLLHLSKIFPTPVVVKGRKPNHWTPTKSEIQLGFLGHYHSEEEFKTFLHDKAVKLASFKTPVRFQPFAAIVGPNVRNVQKCYVVLQANDIYQVDTPFAAIDFTFKASQVLDAAYPAESKLVWLVVQQAIYKVFSDNDKKIISPQLVPILKHFNKK
ncbi:uncharacterized protein LOC127750608 [Frankliniella occidentalis]|uniref:Uncharacterized protein LOC127750608 n=1 Tax=Frankliniella occidentalis TaxID=133901 RepID=A0A9C6X409_FRAOC|nr:uncharacterized protein LOC127750608 [Frankliniella occidentalis]